MWRRISADLGQASHLALQRLKSPLLQDEGILGDLGPALGLSEREIVVYWYSFSNHRTVCIHYGFSLVGNNLNNTLRTP